MLTAACRMSKAGNLGSYNCVFIQNPGQNNFGDTEVVAAA
jgi:hypothetical protein